MSNLQDPKKLKLSGCKVVFYDTIEEAAKKGFKPSFTVELTDEQVKEVNDFYAENKIGKNGDPNKGKSPVKQYTNEKTGKTTNQVTVKYGDKTQWAGVNGLSQEDMGYGAVVNLIISAFEYSIYTGGIGARASAVVLTSGAGSGSEDLAELMSDLGEDTDVDASDVPF